MGNEIACCRPKRDKKPKAKSPSELDLELDLPQEYQIRRGKDGFEKKVESPKSPARRHREKKQKARAQMKDLLSAGGVAYTGKERESSGHSPKSPLRRSSSQARVPNPNLLDPEALEAQRQKIAKEVERSVVKGAALPIESLDALSEDAFETLLASTKKDAVKRRATVRDAQEKLAEVLRVRNSGLTREDSGNNMEEEAAAHSVIDEMLLMASRRERMARNLEAYASTRVRGGLQAWVRKGEARSKRERHSSPLEKPQKLNRGDGQISELLSWEQEEESKSKFRSLCREGEAVSLDGHLLVTLHDARHLPGQVSDGESGPQIRPYAIIKVQGKTRTSRSLLDLKPGETATWNEKFIFALTGAEDARLYVSLFDAKQKTGKSHQDDPGLGEMWVRLDDLVKEGKVVSRSCNYTPTFDPPWPLPSRPYTRTMAVRSYRLHNTSHASVQMGFEWSGSLGDEDTLTWNAFLKAFGLDNEVRHNLPKHRLQP